MSSVPERSAIDEEYTWDLESLFADDEDWKTAYAEAEALIEDLESHEGRATESGDLLLETLSTYEDLMRTVENVASYARMRRDENPRRDQYQAMTARSQSLAADASSAGSFLEPAIQSLERADVEAMIEGTPELVTYEHYLDDVHRMRRHTRSAEVEELLADLSEVTGAAGEVYNMLANADMAFPSVEDPDGEPREVTLNTFTKLQRHPDRDFRREVYETFYDEWAEVHNAVGTALKNSVTADVKLARARDYETAREAALNGPNIPIEVYDTLVETVRDNLDVLHRHADLKRETIGADELRMWDVYVPLVEGESPEIPYEDARQYVTEAVAPLGEAYQSRLADGLHSRWVDVYETEGKQSGAYSGGTYESQPYILMNYTDDVESLYTLAHELGHSLHSEYASEHQPYIYASYDIFIAEIASTVNETLLTHHLLATLDDDRLRKHVLNEYLERFRSTLFRQTMFAEFEQRIHARKESGEALTPDRFDAVYEELKGDYYAPAELDDHIAREWMRIPHFYRAFYVFQYATGISAAVAIVDDVREAGESAATRYLEFLAQGASDYPMALLETVNLDMTSGRPFEAAIETYADALDRFEELT
jgi:oligoendopeptidase F